MSESSSAYEIELRALLSKEQYQKLCDELPKKMTVKSEETIHIQGYKPGDVRLRYSEKRIEIVCKDEDPTKICRREVVVPLNSMEDVDKFRQIFEMIGLKPGIPWMKHVTDFETRFNDFRYEVSLQHVERFAYMLEVEFMSNIDDSHIHESNIRKIIRDLGCEPIDSKEFKKKINEYQKDNYFV